MRFILLLLVSLVTRIAFAAPVDLIDIYSQARTSDPVFKEAKATWLAAKEAIPQGQALLLPSLNATASTMGVRINETGKAKQSTNNKEVTVSLSQPIFNYAAWYGLRSAKVGVKQAAAVYESAGQDLIQRVANAYLDLLLAEDMLQFKQAQEKATSRQLDQAEQRYDVGLVTMTSVYQARAGHDKITAELIAARNDVVTQREALRLITGVYYEDLRKLRADLKFKIPTINSIQQWVDAATQNNLGVVAARFAMQAARESIKQAIGGHLPSLNFVGTYDDLNRNMGSININNATRSLGLQLTLPIFQGGAISSQVRQARQYYQKAQDVLQQQFRAAEFTARQSYNNLKAQISKIKADRQSIKSNESSVKSTEDGYRLGTQTIINVLETQQDLFQAQANLAKDQYAFIKNLFALKQATGSLGMDDLRVVNSWLALPVVPT